LRARFGQTSLQPFSVSPDRGLCGCRGDPAPTVILPTLRRATSKDTRVPPGQFWRRGKSPVLRPAFVTYLDVLGTSKKAVGADAQRTLETLDQSVERARERADLDEDWSWAVSSWFSDNLCIAASVGTWEDFEEGIFGSVLLATAWVQYLLAIDGFFTRGGMSVGLHFMDRRINFGAALVEAVALEKQTRFPHVVVGSAVRPWIDKFCGFYARYSASNPFRFHLASFRGQVFVNYLGIVYEADTPAEGARLLDLHRQAVRQNLIDTAAMPRERLKARWSAGYHNWMCHGFDYAAGRIRGNFPRSFESFVPTTWLGSRCQP
jgi:hypothetical protein